MLWLVFMGNFIRLRSRRIIPAVLEKVQRSPGIGPPPTFSSFMVDLRAVMALVGMSFS